MKKIRNILGNVLNKSSIKNNLQKTFLFFFLLPVAVISVFFIVFLYTTLEKNEIDKIENSIIQTEQKFNGALSSIQNFSDRLYVNKHLKNVLSKNYSNIQEIYDSYGTLYFLEDYLSTYDEVSGYRFYCENETLLDNQFIVKVTDVVKKSDWYKNALKRNGQVQWVYAADYFTGKEYLSLVRSVWRNDEHLPLGVLVINLNPEYVQKILNEFLYESYIFIEDNVVYDSNIEKYNISDEELASIIKDYNFESPSIERVKNKRNKIGIFGVSFTSDSVKEQNFKLVYLIPMDQPIKATQTTIIFCLVFIVIMLILSSSLIFFYSYYIDRRVNKINKQIDNIVDKNFEIAESIGGNDEFEQIYRVIFSMSEKLKNLIEEVYQKNIEKEQLALQQSEISFKMLANQINPHFLFNTIETIRMKSISTGDKEVATMLKLLAGLLRYNLNAREKTVLLQDELMAIQNYLTIQNMRFGDRVTYDVVTMSALNEVYILPLLIQPIVENSFNHGLENRIQGGFIYVLISTENIDDKLHITIEVRDNGDGIPENKLKEIQNNLMLKEYKDNQSIGLYNVNSRVKMFYEEGSGVSIQSSQGQGTTVTIKIIQKIKI